MLNKFVGLSRNIFSLLSDVFILQWIRFPTEPCSHHAMGKLEAGSTQRKVAQKLGYDISTVRRWWAKYKNGESLRHHVGAGPEKAHKIAKIAITQSLEKRHQSICRLSKRLKTKCVSVSKNTVHLYLTNELKSTPFKRQKQPRISDKQKKSRLKFFKENQHWTTEDWKNVLWSDECLF